MNKAEKKITIEHIRTQDASLIDLLSRPHIIKDNKNRFVSTCNIKQVIKEPEIKLTDSEESVAGFLQCLEKDKELFTNRFVPLENTLECIHTFKKNHYLEILEREFETILHQSCIESISLEQLLIQCCCVIRAYILADNCSIFGLPEGKTLSGLIAVTPYGIKNRESEWNYSTMGIASLVVEKGKPYVCEDPDKDPFFKQNNSSQSQPKRNLVCFPILNKNKPIGVINVAGKTNNTAFTDDDIFVIQKISALLSHILREEFESEQKEALANNSENLGKYLSKNVVKRIANTGSTGDLGGAQKKVVVLFSDIRSFTSISESLKAPDLISLLNFYFNEMTTVIKKYNGTVDKLVGDLIMVIWNVPQEQNQPEVLAVRAALEMQKVFYKKVLPKWKEFNVPDFGIGIGINSGQAVVGNLGSKDFMNYTVIGSNINTAQRLEAKAKAGEVWVHPNVQNEVHGKVPRYRRIEKSLRLKGLSKAIDAYVYALDEDDSF